MNTDEEKSRLQALVNETREQRARVKRLVAAGHWQKAETDSERSKAYATQVTRKRAIAPSSSAEAIVGNTTDYQAVSFLVEGARTRRAVGFVEVNTPTTSELGSGFLVSPRLFMTNQHVVRDAITAQSASVTFDREMDETGRPRATTVFQFAPEICAIFSPEDQLDYALIAIGARISGEATLPDLGYCMLSDTPDRHVIGMNVNIVQHPNGWPKTVALRNNTLTFRTDRTLLYETDTQTGSSGAPVFNDGWDLVALHHYGAPFLERVDEDGNPLPQSVNEGVRISAIVRDLKARLNTFTPAARELVEEALSLASATANSTVGRPTLGPPRPSTANSNNASPQHEAITLPPSTNQGASMNSANTRNTVSTMSADGTLRISIPLEISVRLGDTLMPQTKTTVSQAVGGTTPKTLTHASEALKIDQNYENRSGYNQDFIDGVT
ncbi:MAG: trypsin-like serine peptidase, partial [Casimicrobium sp.]